MQIYTSGTLTVKDGKIIPESVGREIENLFDTPAVSVLDGAVEFSDALGYLGEDLSSLCALAAQNGLSLSGELEYYGDYEGAYIVEDNKFEDVSRFDYELRHASDDVLFEELRRRGYTIATKKQNHGRSA